MANNKENEEELNDLVQYKSREKKLRPRVNLCEHLPNWIGSSHPNLRLAVRDTHGPAFGRGEFKAAFARLERRAAIGQRLPPFVGAPCVVGVRGWEERPSDAVASPANQEWGREAKKEVDPLPLC